MALRSSKLASIRVISCTIGVILSIDLKILSMHNQTVLRSESIEYDWQLHSIGIIQGSQVQMILLLVEVKRDRY